MKITGKYRMVSILLAFCLPYMAFSDSKINKNRKRIAQINQQVAQNRTKISKIIHKFLYLKKHKQACKKKLKI